MRLVQIITDYIRRSILTTQGDLVVRGVGQPERLAAGLAATFLAGQGAGVIPAWEGHKLSDHGMKVGSFNRWASGEQAVGGLGFRPSLCILFARDNIATNVNYSLGIDFVSYQMSFSVVDDNTSVMSSTAFSIYIRRDVSNYLSGYVLSLDNNGFTVTFTLAGVVNTRIRWFAIE